MTTVRDMCTRSLRRLTVYAPDETPSDTDLADTRDALSDLMYAWEQDNINMLLQADWGLNDTFVFFVPPKVTGWESIDVATFKGNWDASANSPALASGQGTPGDVYKVETAGSTTLDSETSWSVNDFLIFDGGLISTDIVNAGVWRKGLSSRRFERGIQALLAVRVAEEFGAEPSALTLRDADNGWSALCAAFIKPPTRDIFDSATFRTPSARYQDYISSG